MHALPVSPATGTGKVRELRAGAMMYSIGATRNSAFVHGWGRLPVRFDQLTACACCSALLLSYPKRLSLYQ